MFRFFYGDTLNNLVVVGAKIFPSFKEGIKILLHCKWRGSRFFKDFRRYPPPHPCRYIMTAALWSFPKQNKFRNEIVSFIWICFFMWCFIFTYFNNLQNQRQIQLSILSISNLNSNCTIMFEFLCNGFCGVIIR